MSTNKKCTKETLKQQRKLEPRSCVRVEVAIPGDPSLAVRKTMVSVDVSNRELELDRDSQSSGAV